MTDMPYGSLPAQTRQLLLLLDISAIMEIVFRKKVGAIQLDRPARPRVVVVADVPFPAILGMYVLSGGRRTRARASEKIPAHLFFVGILRVKNIRAKIIVRKIHTVHIPAKANALQLAQCTPVRMVLVNKVHLVHSIVNWTVSVNAVAVAAEENVRSAFQDQVVLVKINKTKYVFLPTLMDRVPLVRRNVLSSY